MQVLSSNMAGTNELDSQEQQQKTTENTTFVWDENSQLYYHASTGFYHDPIGGWYYSSKDGLYYKFENGNYVLLESDQGDSSEMHSSEKTVASSFVHDEQYGSVQFDKIDESEAEKVGPVSHESTSDHLACIDNQLPENLPPPSEWLEDTLIELYLSGYSNQAASATSDMTMDAQPNGMDHLYVPADGAGDNDELEEGEWIPDDNSANSSGNVVDEGAMSEEERWRAQYGQATHPNEESASSIRLVDLWDWKAVKESRKRGKGQVTRLVGRLVKRSMKLHPSVASGGGLFKTAPICEVHHDLVRVTSGQIYRLRSPSTQYLASTSSYDSSDPTKDWAFPPLSISEHIQPLRVIGGKCESKCPEELSLNQDRSLSMEELLEMKRSHIYRDRAAERRALHGGFGVGPGQKKSKNDVDSAPSSPISTCPEEAAAESLSLSFGAGSYARRMLESMGWKEGEALGSSTKGLTEPLQAIGNKGNAGLGWDDNRRKSSIFDMKSRERTG